jgi:LPXTG-motif cell wall-anchored protein
MLLLGSTAVRRLVGVGAGLLLASGTVVAAAPVAASATGRGDGPAANAVENRSDSPGHVRKAEDAANQSPQTSGPVAEPVAPAGSPVATTPTQPGGPAAITRPSQASSGNGKGTVGQGPGNGVLTEPQPLSNADSNTGGANGQCPGGPYCSTRDGSASQNGNGGGKAVGKPCAGCVGKADNKNPKGQMPNGSDHNKGYECDANKGIGRTNPAHTGCKISPPPPPPPPPCVPTPANNNCGTPPPPPPPCVPTPANNNCGTPPPPPPPCVPTPANNSCQPTTTPPSSPPACVPGPDEDENCVRVEGTKSGPDDQDGPEVQQRSVPSTTPDTLAHTGSAGLSGLLSLGAFALLVGALLMVASRRRADRA